MEILELTDSSRLFLLKNSPFNWYGDPSCSSSLAQCVVCLLGPHVTHLRLTSLRSAMTHRQEKAYEKAKPKNDDIKRTVAELAARLK